MKIKKVYLGQQQIRPEIRLGIVHITVEAYHYGSGSYDTAMQVHQQPHAPNDSGTRISMSNYGTTHPEFNRNNQKAGYNSISGAKWCIYDETINTKTGEVDMYVKDLQGNVIKSKTGIQNDYFKSDTFYISLHSGDRTYNLARFRDITITNNNNIIFQDTLMGGIKSDWDIYGQGTISYNSEYVEMNSSGTNKGIDLKIGK